MTSSKVDMAFEALGTHRKSTAKQRIDRLFSANSERFQHYSVNLGPLLFDYSKNNISDETRNLLLALARAADVETCRDALFAAKKINTPENRAVQHMALRAPAGASVMLNGENIVAKVHHELNRMRAFADKVRSGEYSGAGGKITDVVNIGIGGSDLGPAMATAALAPYHDGPNSHFVSNIDGADLGSTLAQLDPATTLFIVASKSFSTQETMTNAASARRWLVAELGEAAVKDHFVALSTHLQRTARFGIAPERVFGFWDWVGGRYSVWSAIGLSVMLAIGPENFDEFLAGGHAVDEHFQSAELAQNIPVLMALIGIWHRNICEYPTLAILPYDQHLARFPAYLQQLDMESNGKRVGLDGSLVSRETGPVIWGEPGTNGQHAFYQLLHQGTDIVPADFLIAAKTHYPELQQHHEILLANGLAQSQALMVGKSEEKVLAEMLEAGMDEAEAKGLASHRTFPGNRPSNTFLYQKLTPKMLGMLIALYEHKIFVQGVIWGINSFDQWGVELGKVLAADLLPLVQDQGNSGESDGSTAGLLEAYHRLK